MEKQVDKMADLMRELQQEYIAEFHTTIEECEALASKHDVKGLGGLGHRLKGNGASYGFPEITDIGDQIEQLAKADNFDAILSLIDNLKEIQAGFEKTTTNPPDQQT